MHVKIAGYKVVPPKIAMRLMVMIMVSGAPLTDYSNVLGAEEYGSGIDGANGYKHVAPLCLLFG